MKFGFRLQGAIKDYDEKGRGTFEVPSGYGSQTHSSTVIVPFAMKGDVVEATFTRRDRGAKIARLTSIDTPSPDRVATVCPHAGVCGGCLWQHMSYSTQLTLKRDMINRAFEKAGHTARVDHVEPCDLPEPFRYRNRMDYAVGWNGEIGLKEYDSWNRYVDLKACFLLGTDPGALLDTVRGWMREHDLQPWDAKFHVGDIRYVVIREGRQTRERMVSIIVHDALRITPSMRKDLTTRLDAYATTILLGEQSKPTDLSLAQTYEALKGEPWLEEETNGVRYRIAPNSFFQTNSHMAAALQRTVRTFLTMKDTPARLLDLYCGLGFFGIALAKLEPGITSVHGHELDAEAINLASHNAMMNGVADRCTFTAGPAEDLSWKDHAADAVIIDPPRAGLHPRVIKALLDMRPPQMVYVSCNYHRLVEELKELGTAYNVAHLTALDLFPHTPHVEVVAHLVRT